MTRCCFGLISWVLSCGILYVTLLLSVVVESVKPRALALGVTLCFLVSGGMLWWFC